MVEGQDVYSFSGNSSDFGNRGTLVDGGRLRPKSERTTDPSPDPLALGHDDGRFKNLHGPAEVPSAVIAHQPTRSTLSRLPALRRFLHGGAEKRVHEREAVEDMGGPLVLPKETFSLIIGTRASIEQQSQDRSGTTHVGIPPRKALAGRSVDHRRAAFEIDPGALLAILLSNHDDPQFLTAHQKVIVLADVAHLALVEIRRCTGKAILVVFADEAFVVEQVAANVLLQLPDPPRGARRVRLDQGRFH